MSVDPPSSKPPKPLPRVRPPVPPWIVATYRALQRRLTTVSYTTVDLSDLSEEVSAACPERERGSQLTEEVRNLVRKLIDCKVVEAKLIDTKPAWRLTFDSDIEDPRGWGIPKALYERLKLRIPEVAQNVRKTQKQVSVGDRELEYYRKTKKVQNYAEIKQAEQIKKAKQAKTVVPVEAASAAATSSPQAAPTVAPVEASPPTPEPAPAPTSRILAGTVASGAELLSKLDVNDRASIERARFDVMRGLCKKRMRAFFRLAWPIIEPSTALLPNWHIDAICDHLEAVSRGEIRKLAIAIPGRCLKSSIVSVAFLPWVWTFWPAFRAIHAAYAEKLSLRDSIAARRLVESDWYRQSFCVPDGWMLREDRNTQDAFANTKGGHRLSLSVGGRALGEGGLCLVADDPQSTDSVYSKADREATTRWWFETMTTRVDDPSKASFIIVQQRLSPEDLIGVARARELGYEYLCLPQEFVPSRRFITYRTDPVTGARTKFWEDPRQEPGELLFPARYSREILADQKKSLGSAAYAAQHQQDPTDATHALFKPAYWRFWRPATRPASDIGPRPAGCIEAAAVDLPKRFDRLTIGVDCTLLEERSHDYTVVQAWGSVGPDRYLLEQHRGKFSLATLTSILIDMATNRYRGCKILVEEAVIGPAVVSSLKRQIPGVMGLKVQGEGKKEQRIASVLPQIESGNVFLPDGAGLLDDLIAEGSAFPGGKHDDQLDVLAHVLRSMANEAVSADLPILGASIDLWGGRRSAGGSAGAAGGPIALGLGGGRYDRPALLRRFR